MSTKGSTNAMGQSPKEEILDRVAENFPTWQIPRLIGIDHLNKMLAACRARVNDSHKLQMAKLQEVSGHDVELEKIGDEMSDIRVAGDTTNYINQSSGITEKLMPLLLTAGITAAGMWYALGPKAEQPATKPDANWQLGLKVTDQP